MQESLFKACAAAGNGNRTVVIATLLLEDWLKGFFDTGGSLGVGFLFTAFVLLVVSKIPKGKKSIEESKGIDAFLIGCGQAIALLPGVSRSGMTISASLSRGLKREVASKFSFLLSIPVILGALVFDIYDLIKDPSLADGIAFAPLAVGMIAAGFCGYLAVRFMIKAVNRGKLNYFPITCLLSVHWFWRINYLSEKYSKKRELS